MSIYFDILPAGTLENIVRQMSDSPRAKNWPRYMRLKDIYLLCRTGGELGTFMQTYFDSVCIIDLSCPGYISKMRQIQLSPNMLMLDASKKYKHVIRYIILFLIANLRTLTVGQPFIDEFSSTNLLDILGATSQSLTRLSLTFTNAAWIKRFGGKLISLELGWHATRKSLESVNDNCIRLRELHVPSFNSADGGGRNIWEKIGDTLEKLSITFCTSGDAEIAKIEANCRKLKWLHAKSPVNASWKYALGKCIMSYGSQLKYALVETLPEEEIRRIVAACPNADFKIHLFDETPIGILNELGHQLIEAKQYTEGIPFFEYDTYSCAWSSCSNLQILQLWRYNHINYIRTVFETPKRALRQLDIYTDAKGCELEEIFDLIANRTGSLEALILRCIIPERIIAFNTIVKGNNQRISSLKLRFEDGADLTENSAKYLVDLFLSLESLEELDMEDRRKDENNRFEAVEKRCALNMARSVCVIVNNVHYR